MDLSKGSLAQSPPRPGSLASPSSLTSSASLSLSPRSSKFSSTASSSTRTPVKRARDLLDSGGGVGEEGRVEEVADGKKSKKERKDKSKKKKKRRTSSIEQQQQQPEPTVDDTFSAFSGRSFSPSLEDSPGPSSGEIMPPPPLPLSKRFPSSSSASAAPRPRRPELERRDQDEFRLPLPTPFPASSGEVPTSPVWSSQEQEHEQEQQGEEEEGNEAGDTVFVSSQKVDTDQLDGEQRQPMSQASEMAQENGQEHLEEGEEQYDSSPAPSQEQPNEEEEEYGYSSTGEQSDLGFLPAGEDEYALEVLASQDSQMTEQDQEEQDEENEEGEGETPHSSAIQEAVARRDRSKRRKEKAGEEEVMEEREEEERDGWVEEVRLPLLPSHPSRLLADSKLQQPYAHEGDDANEQNDRAFSASPQPSHLHSFTSHPLRDDAPCRSLPFYPRHQSSHDVDETPSFSSPQSHSFFHPYHPTQPHSSGTQGGVFDNPVPNPSYTPAPLGGGPSSFPQQEEKAKKVDPLASIPSLFPGESRPYLTYVGALTAKEKRTDSEDGDPEKWKEKGKELGVKFEGLAERMGEQLRCVWSPSSLPPLLPPV
ncbi:hypothetical protein JCM8547_004328 [Rhodosporidiobolus lusitaniae]